MWNSSSAVLWNKSSETDFCGSHWVEWEESSLTYLRECGTLLLLCSETNPLRLTSVGSTGLNENKPIESYTWENVELFCVFWKQSVSPPSSVSCCNWRSMGFVRLLQSFGCHERTTHLSVSQSVGVGVCVCMIEGREKQISQMSVKEVRSRWPSSTCREREKQEWELGNVVCSL